MKTITVETTINAPIEIVWEYWNEPQHITGWAIEAGFATLLAASIK